MSLFKTAVKLMLLMVAACNAALAHDTTHVHPLITAEIAELIQDIDISDGAYADIYVELADEDKDPNIPANLNVKQRLYWGTDFDPVGIANANNSGVPLRDYLSKGQEEDYLSSLITGSVPILKNVITGVVHEDNPPTKVRHHFYQGKSGIPLDVPGFADEQSSSVRAMGYFNLAIDVMGGYSEEAKQEAFFMFGHALHHVEDMIIPAHIHNDAENVLFVPMRRYSQLKNTHVDVSTLRFLNCPCLALKQTERFLRLYL